MAVQPVDLDQAASATTHCPPVLCHVRALSRPFEEHVHERVADSNVATPTLGVHLEPGSAVCWNARAAMPL